MKTLYLIDGHYQIYRAFYGAPQQLTSPSGEPTGATHAFCMMLLRLIRDRRPDYLAMVMDVSDETVFRREIDPDYKAHRDPAPEALHRQADRIESIIHAMGIPLLRLPGFEADDVMATIAQRLRNEDVKVHLVSRDKDLQQLITDNVLLYDPTMDTEMDSEKLLSSKGYTPLQAVEIQTLVGDATDNIPGIPGVGNKTAIKLIEQYGTAEAVVENAEKLTPKLSLRVKAYRDQLPITRRLVTLRRDVPIEFTLDSCALDRTRPEAVRSILADLQLTTVRQAWEDLMRPAGEATPADRQTSAATVVAGGGMRGSYDLIDSEPKLNQMAERLAAQPVFAFDTETTGLNPVRSELVGMSFSWEAGHGCYVPVQASMGDTLPLDSVVQKLCPIFADESTSKIAHNLKYDMLILRQVGVEVRGPTFDTMIASFVLDPLMRSHSLDVLAKAICGHTMIPISDVIGKGKDQVTMDQVDTRTVCTYAAEDADFTWRLYEAMAPRLKGGPLEKLFYETEMPIVHVLAEMQQHGIALDVRHLARLGNELGDRMVELTRDVHQAAGHPFNLDSPKQLATVLFDELGFSPTRKTKTGRSTDAETLQALAGQGDHPLPALVLEYRELAKLKSTYVDTLPRMVHPATRRIHGSFNQTGAITGRLSSNEPNLQNIPIRTATGRRIREAFVAGDAEHELLSADYSQIELRLLAHFCQDAALLEAFRQGEDIHRTVAAQVNDVTPQDVTPEQRGAAKAVNFGIIYGQGAFGLGRSLGISQSDARSFIDRYFERFPGIRVFIDACVDRARERGFAETILGRRRPIPELHSRNRAQVNLGKRLAVNTVVQGSAADLIKRAMIDIHRTLQSEPVDARMLVQVHDELVFEVARDDIDAVKAIVRARMENSLELSVPLSVDMASGPNWAHGK